MNLFLFGCIPTRLGLTALSYYYFDIIRWGLLIIGLSFLILYFFNLRQYGLEVNNAKGGLIWWDNFRPIHGILYILGFLYGWVPILIDTFFGLTVYLLHNFS